MSGQLPRLAILPIFGAARPNIVYAQLFIDRSFSQAQSTSSMFVEIFADVGGIRWHSAFGLRQNCGDARGGKISSSDDANIKAALAALLDATTISKVILPVKPAEVVGGLETTLLHVRFKEDQVMVDQLVTHLWRQSVTYALPKAKVRQYQKRIKSDPTVAVEMVAAVKSAFMDFNKKYPHRADEVGEVLAYCICLEYLKAAQIAAKMALKTSSNMPVHGLDGIHAAFEDDAVTVYFLEAKLSKSEKLATKMYVDSVADFATDKKQYLREYSIVSDLGNFDALQGKQREIALKYFDILGNPDMKLRERFVGVLCYSEKAVYADSIPVSKGPVDKHEKHFAKKFLAKVPAMQVAAAKALKAKGLDPAKSKLFFVAVPDADKLRELFHMEMAK